MSKTREEWLLAAVPHLGKLFKQRDMTIPEKVRVSCGWPAGGGKARIGECWDYQSSADGTWELFISPVLAKATRVLDVLAHELVHVVVGGSKEGHGPVFRKAALAIGLTGKMTATEAGPELQAELEKIVAKLGDYPHAVLTRGVGMKKQGTRMLKLTCPGCGYVVRTTAKWLEVGLPTCVCGEEFATEE